MGYAPSMTILAKNVIGQGIEQAQDRDHDKLDIATRVGLYNFALNELFTLVGFIDTEAWLTNTSDTAPTSGNVAKHGKFAFTTQVVDKITALKFKDATLHSTIQYEGFDIPLRDFLTHLRNGSAQSPYDDGIVYIQVNKNIEYLIGENLDLGYNDIIGDIYYRRVPTPLTVGTYETAYFDAPDRFYSLAVNRIASLVESQKGITDKSLVLVKTAYEQLLASIDPTVKAGILKSLSLPAGEAHDVQGHISKGS